MSTPVEQNTAEAAIIQEEEQIFHRVQSRCSTAPAPTGVQTRVIAANMDQQLIGLRDEIREAKPEDHASLVEQMTRLSAIRSRLGGSRNLPIDPQSPYFAHLALREQGKRRDILIGKRSFVDRDNNIHIVDWRNAPISQVYYRYDEGDDYEEEIAGRNVEGMVEVRRNISIAGGRLRRIGTPKGTFLRDARNVWHQALGNAAPTLQGGQGTAIRASRRSKKNGDGKLGVHHGFVHRADRHMPEIAALIDREQFQLITQPQSGLVVIQGGAGSGKTTVALHRIAYLNFQEPRLFRPQSILFVVPSHALMRYVSEVLPSLGVRGVPVVTYEDWARTQRNRILGPAKRTYNEETPEVVSKLKKHPLLLKGLEVFVAEEIHDITGKMEQFTQQHDGTQSILRTWSQQQGALVPRLRRLHSHLEQSKSAMAPASFHASLALLKRLRSRANDLLTDWEEILTDKPRLKQIFQPDPTVSTKHIEQLITWCTKQSEFTPPTTDDPSDPLPTAADGQSVQQDTPAGRLDREDDAIILRLAQLKRGGLVDYKGNETIYNHVAIDEAQDRSAIEVKILLEATRQQDGPMSRSVTIAGDTAQRVVFDNGFIGWQELLKTVGHAATMVHPLRLSYRSTAEVMHLAQQILGPELAPQDPLVARSGAPVELHEFGDVGEVVAFLADALRALIAREPTASTAIIARYPEQADVYFAGLTRADVPKLRRVRGQDFAFLPGVDVTDIGQVKGLEFDYVILVDVTKQSYPDNRESRHLLHIGATRAAHQLWLTTAGDPSPLLVNLAPA